MKEFVTNVIKKCYGIKLDKFKYSKEDELQDYNDFAYDVNLLQALLDRKNKQDIKLKNLLSNLEEMAKPINEDKSNAR